MKRTFSLILCIAIIVVCAFGLQSASPIENATAEPTREPTATAVGEQSAEPTENATPTASREPMATPSENPSGEPRPTSSENPTASGEPTATAVGEPSVSPTENVTATPTREPATPENPTPMATGEQSAEPTETPTPTATPVPTPAPTATPVPTPTPTLEPELMYLYGLSEEALPGCNTKSREWSCGRFTRNDDGTVTVNWDKKQEALDIIKQYNGFDRGSFDEKVIYLTLNIGFENDSVYKVLDILQEKDVKASFFVVCLSLYDDLAPMIQRIYDEGHIVGAHGYYHESMPFQTARRVVDSYTLCSEFLKNILGENYELKYVRPPAGAICERDLAIADNLGLKTVLWTASYNDYDDATMPTNEEALQYFDSCIFSGSVIQLHATSEQTARLLRKYIDKAQSLGYRFGLISEIG